MIDRKMITYIKKGYYFCIVLIILSNVIHYLPKVVSEPIVTTTKTHHNVHKVIMTQKGYIQFLRYKVDVPPLSRFTFCIWLKSINFTHAHPIISYSLHERDRLLRAWISPGGRWLKVRILEQELPAVKVDLREFKWTHVCLSWHAGDASWQAYIDGKLRGQGTHEKLRDIIIPGGGDFVVGQEYTDFDKGLDDGIEGEIFGFNMILSSTSEAANHNYYQESRNYFHSVPPNGDDDNYQSEYIRFADLPDESDRVKETNLKNVKPEHTFDSNSRREIDDEQKKVDTKKLRIVTNDFYKVDVDYVARKPNKARDGERSNDHTLEIEYFPKAPKTFSPILKSPSKQRYVDSDDEYLTDSSPGELLRPPNPNAVFPIWQHINKLGKEGKFKVVEDDNLYQEGIIENHPLPLNNLPIYETPPALPVYHNPEPEVPSYEVKYAQENFKGNEWYDQNDYFPKELLRYTKTRRPTSHRHKSHHHGKTKTKSKNKHHHPHHHQSRRPHQHKHKHSHNSHAETSELFPYPSEKEQVYVSTNPDVPMEKRKYDVKNNHSVFKRDASNSEKNIQILNPESVIVFPNKNEVVNVEVFPRAGEFPSIDYDTNGDEEYQKNDNNFMTVVLTLENQKRLKNHRLNQTYYDSQSSNTHDYLIDPNLQNQHQTKAVEFDKALPKPSYEVLYSQKYYTGNKNTRFTPSNHQNGITKELEFNAKNYTGRWREQSFDDLRFVSVDKNIPNSGDLDNTGGYNHFILNKQILYNNPIYSHVANAFDIAKNNKESVPPKSIEHNFESLRIKNKNGVINPYSLFTNNQNKRIEPSLIKRYPESIHDKINGLSDFKPYSTSTEATKKNEHAQFGKPVKLGNALNEIQIFRQHGNDRVTSFINSNDRVPDIHKYRSDIDEREDVQRPAITHGDINKNDGIYIFNDLNVNNHEIFERLQRKSSKNLVPPPPLSAGRKLVELSYRKCLLGRGSPLASDPSTLISWTLTPVRVFGGAILKHAQPSCGSF